MRLVNLPGDGIGPEISSETARILRLPGLLAMAGFLLVSTVSSCSLRFGLKQE